MKKQNQHSEIAQRMLNDLERSGIDETHVTALGLRAFTPEETTAWMKGDYYVPTYEIPYHNSQRVKTGYSRLKNLEVKKKFGSTKAKQSFKYLQKTNTAPHLYIPPVYDWPRNADGKIIVDKLVITEGEKKAIKSCLAGIPCVALGGVDAFKSAKRGIFLLEEFDEFDLEVTDIEICYDSDFNTNESVRRAMHQLAAELTSRNPSSIGYVILDGESTGDGKLGLDDFLCLYETDEDARMAFADLPRRIDSRQNIMNVLDAQLCYLHSAGKLYNIPGDRYYDSNAALITDLGPKYRVPDPDDPRKQIPAVKLWMETRSENTWCEGTVYEPGKPKRYRPADAKLDYINVWRSSDVKPIQGDCDLWLGLVKYVMGSESNMTWFLQWLAYPLQHPGSKLLSSVFVYSNAQGVGKNFIIEPLIRKLYGKNYQVITSSDLESSHNAWASKKQFIFGEEIYMSDKRDRESTMGKLKSLISNEFVSVNQKYRPLEEFKNYAQYYLTANQSNALALDRADRRFFVVHAPEKPLSEDFYKALHNWSLEPDSAGKVLSYLMNEVDVSQFNPHAHAPYTDDKDEVIEQGRDMIQSYVSLLADNPKKIFMNNGVLPDQHLFTTQEIYVALNNYARNNNMPELRVSHDSLGRYLSNAHFPHRRVTIVRAKYRRTLYALFYKKKWRAKHDKDWVFHFRVFSPEYQERKISRIEGKPREKADVIDIKTKEKIQ